MAPTPDRPSLVLVINNNPDRQPGRYTPILMEHVRSAGLPLHEVRTVQDVDTYAGEVAAGAPDVGLIVTCGSPVVLTEPVDIAAHITKTTAAMLHFPNAPVVGICFGMQLLAVLYGGSLVAEPDIVRSPDGGKGAFCPMRRTALPSRLLRAAPGGTFLQWASNYIFLDRPPSRFHITAVDGQGRAMAMEHMEEQVYGVLFHPEVIGDGVSRNVIDSIFQLAGRNRRMKAGRRRRQLHADPRHALAPAAPAAPAASSTAGVNLGKAAVSDAPESAWQCSAQCHLRTAVRDAVQGKSDQSLPERLATAKREALARLQRDHCAGGGITISALEDAIRSLSALGGAVGGGSGEPPGLGRVLRLQLRQRGADGQERVVETCSPHAADLELRAAVRDALRRQRDNGGAGAAASSRATSAGSAMGGPRSGTGSASAGGSLADGPPASEAGHQDYAAYTPVASGESRVSVHEADLRLRKVVQEVLLSRGGAPSLAKALCGTKRAALDSLRRGYGGATVPEAALAEAEASLLQAAALAG